MATLDTALLIQPVVTSAPTTAMQSKPAEGFQQVLDDETYKVRNPAPQPKATAVGSRAAREAFQPAGRHSSETKAPPVPDSNDACPAVKPEAGAAKARSKAPAKVAQRRAATHDSQLETTEGLTEVEAESTQRQDLPSEMAGEVSGPGPLKSVAKPVENAHPAPVAQTASAAGLEASLLMQAMGDLEGTQVTVEAELQVAEPLITAGLPTLPATAPAGAPSTSTEAWTSSAMPIFPEVFASTQLVGDASVAATVPVEIIQEPANLALPETWIPSELADTTAGKGMTVESPVSEIKTSESAAVFATGQEAATGQAEPVPQNAVQIAVAQADPLAVAGKPTVAENPQNPDKSRRELAGKEPPELEVRPELLTSRSLPQQSTETAAGETPQKDHSYSNQQEAKPEGSEIVHNLKSEVIPGKEISRPQPAVHTEIQETKENLARRAAQPASLLENPGTATKAPREAAFNTVAATEPSSSVVNAPESSAPVGLAEPTGKVVGTSHANVNWSQVEKAQVVSQIVERAHLLGKNQSELMVVLKPEFLGKVNLHAAMVNNQLVATIIAESASVKQLLESQLGSLQAALHEQGLPVAKVEVVQGSQLSFADLGAGQSSSQQNLESGKSQLPPSLSRYEPSEESAEVLPLDTPIYTPPTSRSVNLVA